MKLDELSVWHRWAIAAFFAVGLGALTYLWIQRFIGLDVGLQNAIAVAFGVASLAVGAGSALFWGTRHLSNASLKRLGITWGLMGMFAGMAVLLWAAGFNWLMVAASIVTFVFWRIGRSHLASAASTERKK